MLIFDPPCVREAETRVCDAMTPLLHPLPAGVDGHAQLPFGPAADAFGSLVSRGRGGGALVVRMGGETVLDLCTGWADRAHTRPWTPETLALSFSTTKGVASTVVHRLAERGELAYDEPIATYWPEFAAGGKERVTVRDLLTHRAGLWSVRAVAERPEDLLDHLAMEERLAARSVRAPTERSAYHAITYGWLVAGLARRVTGGRGLAELVRTEVAEPLGVERAAHRRRRDDPRVRRPARRVRAAPPRRRVAAHHAGAHRRRRHPGLPRRADRARASTSSSRAPSRRSGAPRCRPSTAR